MTINRNRKIFLGGAFVSQAAPKNMSLHATCKEVLVHKEQSEGQLPIDSNAYHSPCTLPNLVCSSDPFFMCSRKSIQPDRNAHAIS